MSGALKRKHPGSHPGQAEPRPPALGSLPQSSKCVWVSFHLGKERFKLLGLVTAVSFKNGTWLCCFATNNKKQKCPCQRPQTPAGPLSTRPSPLSRDVSPQGFQLPGAPTNSCWGCPGQASALWVGKAGLQACAEDPPTINKQRHAVTTVNPPLPTPAFCVLVESVRKVKTASCDL